jgi:hypothetical protein
MGAHEKLTIAKIVAIPARKNLSAGLCVRNIPEISVRRKRIPRALSPGRWGRL